MEARQPAPAARNINRRGFLQLGVANTLVGSAGLSLLLEACASAASSTVSAPSQSTASVASPNATSSSAASLAASAKPVASLTGSTAAASGTLKLPTYVPFTALKADLPTTPDGVPAGYFTFPANPAKSVPQPPGKGGDVSIMGWTINAPPPALDQNPAWQEMNKQMNVNAKVAIVSLADYTTQVSTVLASGNIPDIMILSINGSSIPSEADFLASSCADLTPFLSGDNIKDFPNLANFPPFAWPNSVVNGKMYFVPVLGGVGGNSVFVQQKALDKAGVTGITNADDFMKAAKAVTIAGTQYALASNTAITSPLSWFTQMFGAPNGWRESGGKLTKDWETDEFAAGVAYTRSLWDAGVIHPDQPAMSPIQSSTNFNNGKVVMYLHNLAAFPLSYRAALAIDPQFNPKIIKPFSQDGKAKPIQYLGTGANALTVLKKGTPDRVKEVLGVLNFLAAPFGTQEMLLRAYGVKDTDYSLDAKGNPMLTPKGNMDITVPWSPVVSAPEYFYYPALPPDPINTVYQAEMDAFAIGVRTPIIGLYSKTDSDKGTPLKLKMTDGLNAIIYGRSPVSSLKQLVTDWQNGGGNDIRGEYEKALQDSKK